MKSKWVCPGGYVKRPSQAIGTFTKHWNRENCWMGFVEGRAAIAYLRKARPGGTENEQEFLVIFDDPYGDHSGPDTGEPPQI